MILDYSTTLGLIGFDSFVRKTIVFETNTLIDIRIINCLNNYNLTAMKIVRGTGMLVACISFSCSVVNALQNTLFPDMISNINLITGSLAVDPTYNRFAFLEEGNGGIFKMFFIDTNNSVLKQVASANPLEDVFIPYSNFQGGSIAISPDNGMIITGVVTQVSLFSIAECVQPCSSCDPNDQNVCLECPSKEYQILNGKCIIPKLSCDLTCSTCFDDTPNSCLSCYEPLLWNSSLFTCTYRCPDNCMHCKGASPQDCVLCELGFAVNDGICSPCDPLCLQCSFSDIHVCSLCQSEQSILYKGECVLCHIEKDFEENKLWCSRGDNTTVFIDWEASVKPYINISMEDVPTIEISIAVIGHELTVTAEDMVRLFDVRLQRKDIITNVFRNTMLVQFKDSLRGQDLVEIEISLGEGDNLLSYSEGKSFRLVNRTRKIMYGAMNSTLFGNLDTIATAKPISAALQAMSFLSLTSTGCQANFGGSLISLIQIIEIYGKLFFTPSYFSPLMNISLSIFEKIGNGLKIDNDWIESNNKKSMTRNFFKLTDSYIRSNVLATIPVQALLYLVL
jgi:hypothetical protein